MDRIRTRIRGGIVQEDIEGLGWIKDEGPGFERRVIF